MYEPGTFAFSTTPGRRVEVRGGHAPIFDHRDMVHVLRRPAAIVEPVVEFLDWLPEWLQQCGEHKPPCATVRLPEGYTLGAPPDYALTHLASEVLEAPGPVERRRKE